MNNQHDSVRAVDWQGDHLRLLDQRKLPGQEHWVVCRSAADVVDAISNLTVRGAPAIGLAAAYGVVLAAMQQEPLSQAIESLRAARPTAVHLAWALGQLQQRIAAGADAAGLCEAARQMADQDLAANRTMGELGAAELAPGCGVLTHCNTGSLATSGYGTALGVIRSGFASGKIREVFACETRPWLQGARLTMWELVRDDIPAQLIADSAAAWLMRSGKVQWVIVGADRIAANGDTANKIGSYQLAIAARHHDVRFMVVAPAATIDQSLADGAGIEIETRDGGELLALAGQPTAPAGATAWNPVFDVVPAELIDVLVTERGLVARPDRAQIADLLAAPDSPRQNLCAG